MNNQKNGMIFIIIVIGHQGNLHIRECRILAPVRPRMQAAGLQCLKLQIAVASPDPQTRAFPGTELYRKTRSPKAPRYDTHVVWFVQ